MARTAISGAVVAVLVAALGATGGVFGIVAVWPVLVAVAVGLAVRPITPGRVAAFVVGAVVSWVAMAVRAGFLPDLAISRTLTVVGAVVLLAILATVTMDRVPLWAGLAGYAVFAGLYEPMYATAPTAFLSESPPALLTVLLAAAFGTLIAEVAEVVGGGRGDVGSADVRAGGPGPRLRSPGAEEGVTS